MRRIAVVTVLVAVVALCVAAPALGFATTPPDGAYIWPWDGGSWGTVVDGQQTDVWNPPGTPIPAGTDVYIGSGWISVHAGSCQEHPPVPALQGRAGCRSWLPARDLRPRQDILERHLPGSDN